MAHMYFYLIEVTIGQTICSNAKSPKIQKLTRNHQFFKNINRRPGFSSVFLNKKIKVCFYIVIIIQEIDSGYILFSIP